MEQKASEKTTLYLTTTPPKVSTDYLAKVELLPDGTMTNKQDIWLKSWADFTRREVLNGRIKLHEVPEYDPETGQVPTSFIHDVYMRNRRLN